MRTQVAIIGGGPSGLLLSHLLYKAGIETVILEKQSREYVLSRIRAGVLEWGTVDLLQKAGLGNRMAKEGFIHNGTYLSSQNRGFRIDFDKLIKSRLGWDIGLGLTISTPLGPVRLDYAIPNINNEVILSNGKFNFGVQYLF